MPSWVGDTVLATPALAAIRRTWPNRRLILLLRPHLADLLAGSDLADDLITWKHPARSTLRDLLATAATLRRLAPGTAVILPNSFHTALLCWLARIPRRIGYAREARGWLLTDRLAPPRENGRFAPVSTVDYYNQLVRYLGAAGTDRRLRLATLPADEAFIDRLLASRGLSAERPLVLINPGAAFGPSKLWPADRFAELADRLTAERHAACLIITGPADVHIARAVARYCRHPVHVLDDPLLTLGQLKALVRRCRLMITNDTGPRHIAIAFDRPVVTIFGSTDPRWTETHFPRERKVMLSLDCMPCQKPVCPLRHHRCLRDLPVEAVWQAACELWDSAPAPAPASP